MILDTLKKLHEMRSEEIEAWFSREREIAAPYLYNSVDLRHSGVRLVPVDTNLFPAGFNNISGNAMVRAVQAFKRYFEEHAPTAKRALLLPENHTRNLAYLDNVYVLSDLLKKAGLEVVIGSLAVTEVTPLTSLSGHAIEEHPLQKKEGKVSTLAGFEPDVVISNNDFTSGIPEVLTGIAQPVFPPPELGWHTRKKSVHFAEYQKLIKSFAESFGLDPWLLSADFHACGRVDFKERTGVDCVAKAVDCVIERAKAKHAEYGIKEDPYVFVKADSGTYGMGIMNVRSGSEMLEMNKKERNKMHVIKEGAQVTEVIIQEGVPTIDEADGKPAEPMIYLIDGIPIGGMWRVNKERDTYGNLNAAGVEFHGMCDEAEAATRERTPYKACHFRSTGIIAAIAALATAREDYSEGVIPHAKQGSCV